ncbi:Carbon monoxide dehydrogenase medium chain [Anatilimnocola aggregata]|uniref:Carbon monoxide dehydrogenase medium chain n=1 Tax=Anatilimnocola aggregata TaxID=2528021 RepID=A0A517Y609_9BACT|nr:xanthine dehydrogenase family protein subunit M [Anatilimnocola aggregata]QDU25671.1 Carbon monoxide dehydrogenase medium chain [Anatilimnocola aggregata]
MKDFGYAAPESLGEASRLLQHAAGSVKILAGGTDIIVQLREGMREADLVVDVKKVPELQELTFSATHGLRLGASVPCHRVYEHPQLVAAYSALVDASKIIGGWQIQSRASVGGNLCNSSPAADTIPALIAHHAWCEIASPRGKRTVAVEQFCTAPGKNVLQKGELLVAIVFPPSLSHSGSAYERFIPRNEMDIAVVGVGSRVQLNATGDTIEFARIGVGAVAPTPKYAQEASEWLAGKPATEEFFAQAGELAKKIASPISDMRGTAEYRTHLVGVMVKRTLLKAAERAKVFINH